MTCVVFSGEANPPALISPTTSACSDVRNRSQPEQSWKQHPAARSDEGLVDFWKTNAMVMYYNLHCIPIIYPIVDCNHLLYIKIYISLP